MWGLYGRSRLSAGRSLGPLGPLCVPVLVYMRGGDALVIGLPAVEGLLSSSLVISRRADRGCHFSSHHVYTGTPHLSLRAYYPI